PLGPILDALPELADTVDQDAGGSRLRLFRKVRDALTGSPMLLVLEDVHWADEATLDILCYLGRRLAGAELMILATFRSEELSRDHPLTMVLGDLATLPGVIRMQLPPLSAAGVQQLLDEAGPELGAYAIFPRHGGNPVLRHRGTRGRRRAGAGHGTRCGAGPRVPAFAGRAGGRRRGVRPRPTRGD